MTAKMLLFVAAGGAAGACLRYLAVIGVGHVLGHAFPWGTLAVNVLGSFVLGALTEGLALAWHLSPEVRAMVVVGVLGAFTTFSAFSLETVLLFERGNTAGAALYVAVSVLLSVGALVAGLRLMRLVLL